MATAENVEAWSTTAATNSSADSSINWAEGQDPATVNNSARSMMAAQAKHEDDQGGGLAAGGTANALTVTTNQVLSSGHVTAGLRLLLRATADNTSATVTFAPDGLTAANIKRADGSALAVGSIKSGMYLDLVYNSGSSEWRCANIAPARSACQVRLSGTQTVSSTAATTITFDTEDFDIGANFAANTWTPNAGTVFIIARAHAVTLTSGELVVLSIYKNGAEYARGTYAAQADNAIDLNVSAMDIANGTDAYTIVIDSALDASYQVQASPRLTLFQGFTV
jgi:hypothetical protein